MSRFRAYINPMDESGVFTGFQEVTDDVDFNALGTITQKIDNDEYNVGVFTYNDFSLKLRNDHGKYSDVDVYQSIFRYKRSGSKFKLTWEPGYYPPQCGIAVAGAAVGATLTEPIVVFQGILNDEATKLNIDDQKISFIVLSTDSIFEQVEGPYSSLSASDLYSEALYTILNQTKITNYLTVSTSNISVGLDQIFDDISSYENLTVKELLDDILFQSNSILYVRNETVYIKPRDGDVSSSFTFRGQASDNGIEDIIKINDISTGLNKVFNYFRWDETTLSSTDATSISVYGVRKKDISFEVITNTSRRQAILDAQKNEFKDLKMSFELTAKISIDKLGLFLLNQVLVDYPTKYLPAVVGGDIPIYGVAIYGSAYYPYGEFSLTIPTTTQFKIMGIKIDVKKQLMKFLLKEM